MSTSTMRWSPGDIAAAKAVLDRATPDETTALVTLTDEEVVILDGLENAQLVPTPWLDAQDGDRSLLGRVALRSLLARGLVVPTGVEKDEIGIEATADITGPLVLRRTARAILVAHRTTSVDTSWLYLYLHEDDVVLEEEVGTSGHHAFSVYPLGRAEGRLAVYLDPAQAAGDDGTVSTFDADDFATLAPTLPGLADARAVTVLTVARAGDDLVRTASVYTGPGGVHLVRGSGPESGAGPATVDVSEIGTATLRALPTTMLAS